MRLVRTENPSTVIFSGINIIGLRGYSPDLKRREAPVVDKHARKCGIARSQLSNNKQVIQYNIQGEKFKTYPGIAVASKKQGLAIAISVAWQGVENPRIMPLTVTQRINRI